MKESEFPVEPYIEYRSQAVSEDGKSLFFTFYFQDGDGDIGLFTYDTLAPYIGEYRYNIYFIPFEKKNDSVYDTLRSVRPPYINRIYKYRIKYIEAVNANKALKGEIQWDMKDFDRLQQEFPKKTIRFQVYIYDRALHISNKIYSPDINLY
ncbi:MAG: hypothetical protein RR328_06140 [Bacteroidales bacterium]